MNETVSLFEYLYEPVRITKPLRLIELFAGYGSQALALKYLGVPFEHWKIAEWNYKSFAAYNKLHMTDTTDYSKGKTKEQVEEYLYKIGVSADWEKPLTLQQIKRLPEHRTRTIYNDIQATHNLVNVSQIKGNDLEINDDRYTYILTYSFPCQDLSPAGNTAGMAKDSGTRSGLLWEVERLLKECDRKPDILLMENVTQIHNQQNMPYFREWMLSLEKMGYQNYWQDMMATDYGIPQTRNRTFMVSMLGDYFYSFPKPIPLEKRLKDILEDEVDEKYFLSNKQIDEIQQCYEKATDTSSMHLMYGTYQFSKSDKYMKGKDRVQLHKDISDTILTSPKEGVIVTGNETPYCSLDLRIRKLTPTECFRLMGVSNEDIARLHGILDSTKYHLAGDSIVITCLMAIFGEMVGIDWKEKARGITNGWNKQTESTATKGECRD